MACKHRKVEGNITKYFVCGISGKQVDDYKCNTCMMKIEDNKASELFNQIFGKGFGK